MKEQMLIYNTTSHALDSSLVHERQHFGDVFHMAVLWFGRRMNLDSYIELLTGCC
jgi:hypothetical protein